MAECGTINKYNYYRCRCERCRAANAAYRREYLRNHPDALRKHRERDRARRAAPEVRERKIAQTKSSGLRRLYGIEQEDYDQMWLDQGGGCAVCGLPERCPNSLSGRLMRLSVDHDHVTGKVRALLCRACNVALGQLGDSRDRVAALLRYIDAHSALQG